MITAFFIPDGIVVSTLSVDTFNSFATTEEDSPQCSICVDGLCHSVNFWDRYVLIYHQADENVYHPEIPAQLKQVCSRWSNDEVPALDLFMPYIKKQILDCGIQIIGIMAGYSPDADGNPTQYVYQILGSDLRRINVDQSGRPITSHVELEMRPTASRLLHEIALRNGDDWVSYPAPLLHTQFYSIDMAKRVSDRILQISALISHLEDRTMPPASIVRAVITPNKIELNPSDNG